MRETLTEMLAYDHEVRNCLPFLSNFEILFCIVSTEYSTLLNHSITGLVTWESKQILCLSVKESEEDLEIEIYIPPSWTSLGIRDLPSTAISTLKIILYKRSEDVFSPDAESAVLYASSLIAKDGDRNNSHGFVLVWRDCLSLEYLSEYHLTIGFINPYSLLPFAQNLGTIDVSQSPLGQYFLENADNFSSYDCPEVFERGIKFLEKFFCVEIEGLSNWSNDRSKPHEVLNPTSLMYYRAFPLKVELWGALGDFSRDLIVHPGVEKSLFSRFSGKILGCEDPFIAIPLIDNISGARKVDERGFTCRILFDLGVALGSLLTLYNTAIRYEENDLGNLPALITWFMLDIQPVILELGMQYSSSSRLDTPPPPVKFRSHSNFEEALESIECLINWIYTEFLDETEDIHSECFTIGLIIHPLMDQYFSSGLTESQKASFEERVIASSISLLNWLASQCLPDYRSLKYTQHIFYILSNTYFNCEVKNITRESLPFMIDSIAPKLHLDLYHNILIDLLDDLVLPINYGSLPSQNLSEYKYLDWSWIRKEILHFRERGIELPALKVDLMQQVSTVDISKKDYASCLKIDFRHQFIFITCFSYGVEMAFIRNWDEVIPPGTQL